MIVSKKIKINKYNIFFTVVDNYNKLNYIVSKKINKINVLFKPNIIFTAFNRTYFNLISTNIKLLHNIYSNLTYFNDLNLYKYMLKFELVGIGYKVFYIKDYLVFLLGFSHFIKIKLPSSVEVYLIENKYIILKDIKKNRLGLLMYILINLKKFNIYKGKGIKNIYENIKLKLGKSKLLKK